MIPDATFGLVTSQSTFRLRFSLFALFIFVTLVCLALGYLFRPRYVVAEALFQVSSHQSEILGDKADKFDAREYEIFQKTQITRIKSAYVLARAVRPPGIAGLPILAGKADPVAWLQDKIEAEFPNNNEILVIRMRSVVGQEADLVRLVDAVSKAYIEEVIGADKQRQLAQRDLLSMNVRDLREEVKHKMRAYKEKTAELGKDDVEVATSKLELDTLIEQWREAQRALQFEEMNSNAPERVRPIQPATIRPQ